MNAATFHCIFSLISKHLEELGAELATENGQNASELFAVNMSEHTTALAVGTERKNTFTFKNGQSGARSGLP